MPRSAPVLDRAGRVPAAPRPGQFVLKVVMAATGLVFAAFVLVHMIGNLKIYTGAEHFDGYAHWLRTAFMPLLPHEGLLWVLRVVLLGCLVAHLWAGWELRRRGARARGRHRRRPTHTRAWLAHSMPATGVLLLGFLVLHLLDLTTGTAPVASSTYAAGSAYANTIASFQRWPVALAYLVTMLALCAHLAHGLVSVVLDLGFGPGGKAWRTTGAVAIAIALLVSLANMTIPLAVWTGALR